MKILAINGSLRQESSNGMILKAAQNFLKNHDWQMINIADLPYFDSDNQYSNKTPETVKNFRVLAGNADLIFVSTPEYAHGIPGILKNALEWIFCEETHQKPIAIVIGSAQGEWARDQLLEILKTMDFLVSEKSFLIIKGARSKINSEGIFLDHVTQNEFEKFCVAVTERRN